MTYPILRGLALTFLLVSTTPLSAENHIAQSGFGVTYGSEACNNDANFLTENDIVCTAVFSETNIWDFLNTLTRRITFEELVALNPELVIEDYETVLGGITFVRVQ